MNVSMEFQDQAPESIFLKRQSIRSYKPDSVPEELIQALLQAACQAPSAGNCQPWHFYAVRNPQAKEALSAHAHSQRFLLEAPLVIVVCTEAERSATRYKERGIKLYCIQDTAAAVENILLCAAEQGLGTCWVGAFDEAGVAKALDIPAERRPVALLAVGYPGAQPTTRRPRRPLEETVTFVD